MKIRTNFVSNSSSASFLIYGCSNISKSDIKISDELVKIVNKNTKSDYTKETLKTAINSDEIDLYEFTDALGLTAKSPPYGDGYYVGLSWDEVSDDETGLDFKKRAKRSLEMLLGKDIEVDTYSEAWYDG